MHPSTIAIFALFTNAAILVGATPIPAHPSHPGSWPSGNTGTHHDWPSNDLRLNNSDLHLDWGGYTSPHQSNPTDEATDPGLHHPLQHSHTLPPTASSPQVGFDDTPVYLHRLPEAGPSRWPQGSHADFNAPSSSQVGHNPPQHPHSGPPLYSPDSHRPNPHQHSNTGHSSSSSFPHQFSPAYAGSYGHPLSPQVGGWPDPQHSPTKLSPPPAKRRRTGLPNNPSQVGGLPNPQRSHTGPSGYPSSSHHPHPPHDSGYAPSAQGNHPGSPQSGLLSQDDHPHHSGAGPSTEHIEADELPIIDFGTLCTTKCDREGGIWYANDCMDRCVEYMKELVVSWRASSVYEEAKQRCGDDKECIKKALMQYLEGSDLKSRRNKTNVAVRMRRKAEGNPIPPATRKQPRPLKYPPVVNSKRT